MKTSYYLKLLILLNLPITAIVACLVVGGTANLFFAGVLASLIALGFVPFKYWPGPR